MVRATRAAASRPAGDRARATANTAPTRTLAPRRPSSTLNRLIFEIDDPAPERAGHGRRAILDAELRKDVLHVHLHGLLRPPDGARDRAVVEASRGETEDLNLARRQVDARRE